MAVNQSLTLTQVSQNIVNNYSSVRILWTSTQTGESWNGYARTAKYWISMNGGAEKEYSVSYTLPKGTTKTILDTTITVPHNADGTGSVKVRTWLDTGISAGVIQLNKNLALTTIPRQSSLSVGNGTLGTQQTLRVTQQATSFTHSITWKCGSMSGTICEKSKTLTFNWIPDNELATQAPSANHVSVTFTITTYSGNTAIGSTPYVISCAIPYTDTFSPVLGVNSADAMGYASKYETPAGTPQYVQSKSKLYLDIQAYGSYGAWIKSYSTTFEGKTYTTDKVTTELISGYGTLRATISVIDSRERKLTIYKDIVVLPYEPPKITSLSAFRQNSSGETDHSGESMCVNYVMEVSSLYDMNHIQGWVEYKRTTDSKFTKEELVEVEYMTGYNGIFSFSADTASSYDIVVTIKDDFHTITKSVVGPSVKKVWSLKKIAGEIVGAALGKIAELTDVFDIAFQTRFTGGLLHSVLPNNADLDLELTPKTYMLLSANNYYNAPESGKGMFLEIVGTKEGSLIQRCSIFDKVNPREYERIYYSTTGWGEWICVRGDFVVEHGEKDGWIYRKWNSGVAECFKILTHTTAITTAWGSMFTGTATARQSYPFPFVSKPTETVSLTSGSDSAWLVVSSGGNGVNGAYASACYNVCRPSAVSTNVTFYMNFRIVGKWK